MSVTVDNPNEVAKVKHLLALAESIAEKIDGGGSSADTRQDATFAFNSDIQIGTGGTWGENYFTTNSDGELSVEVHGNHDVLAGFGMDSNTPVLFTKSFNNPTAGTLTIRITGTENYKPFEQTYNFTV